MAGDTLLAIALADSLFFDVDPNDARWKVGAYLLLTIAPFAVIAPFLGPVMDRIQGGHRYMIIGTAVTRAALMTALVVYVQDWQLFPLAFAMLVMGKTYAVAKSAVVPTTVDSEEALVRSNSRLSILSAVSGATAGIPGVILLRLGEAPWVLGFGVGIFILAAVFAMAIPATKVAVTPVAEAERAELKGANILVASSAMGYLRGAVGFVTMLLAFDLRGGIDPGPSSAGVEIGHRVREALGFVRLDLTSGGAPPWHFGVALIGVGVGGLLGSAGVPRVRDKLTEERILAYGLISLSALAALAAISTGLAGAFIMAFSIALAAQGGKQAFDAIVQRDAPRANLGRTFSRYESRFQMVWVLGALLPVVIPLPARIGFIMVAVSAAFVAATYWYGRTPNPAAIASDGILDEGLDRLAGILPGSLGQRLSARTWGRRVAGASPTGRRSAGRAKPDPVSAAAGSARPADEPVDRTMRFGTHPEPTGRQRRVDPTQRMPYDPDKTTIFPDEDDPTGKNAQPSVLFPDVPDMDEDPPSRSGRSVRARPPVRRPPAEPDTWPSRQP